MRANPFIASLRLPFCCAIALPTAVLGAATGPAPQVPAGGGPPGAFPNTTVSAVNVVAKGSATFNSNVEITGYDGQGPVGWTVTKYNRGDIAMRLAPANPAAADANTLNRGFVDFTSATDAALAECQSWRPNPVLGVAIPTARQNGPIDWGDGEGEFYPTVAISASSSGPGYDMTSGAFGTGQLDINLGRAGTHGSSPEGNFGFSVAWFPYDAGWIGGNVGNPADITTGAPQWNGAGQHAAGLSAGLMTWTEYPEFSQTYGGLGQLRLPGVNALTDGMLFTTSSHGNSDVNIVGVAPTEDVNTGSSGWIVTVREDAALTGDEVATAGQYQFEFVYVPYNAQNLIGGYIAGTTGAKIKSAGTFTLTRTAAGVYELAIPGKTGSQGTLVLQVADFEADTSVPMASRAFLSYQYNPASGKFVIQSRKATSDAVSDLTDASFYFAWVDFANPLAPPAGPRLRNLDAVAVSQVDTISAKEGNMAVNTEAPEVLVTTIDQNNSGGYVDPTSGNVAVQAIVGYFYDTRTLTLKRGPFFIMGNGSLGGTGQINRHDVKYNPVSHQYVVVGNARAYSADATDVLMIARVNPDATAGANEPLADVFVYDGLTTSFASPLSYDDVSVAVSTKNGNFIVVAEHKEDSPSGEGAYGALFGPNGAVLTPTPAKLDLLQPTGDVDDPDVAYLPNKDVFFFFSNTDMSGGIGNHIVGSVVQTIAAGGKLQVSGPEQSLSPGTGVQGHPAVVENPFNGEIITAYDFGNGTAQGNLSYSKIGAGPGYAITQARSEIPYLAGTGANPLKHQHPQLAVDPVSGLFIVGYQARESSVGLPNAYVFNLLDSDGAMMPSQFGKVPYYLTDNPAGPIDTGANYHNVKYDPSSGSFIVAFTAGNNPSRVLYLASLTVTSSHLAPPSLTIERSGTSVVIRWPATAVGYALKATSSLASPVWAAAGGTPVADGAFLKVTLPVASGSFFRLER
jgi:hypothetical protein